MKPEEVTFLDAFHAAKHCARRECRGCPLRSSDNCEKIIAYAYIDVYKRWLESHAEEKENCCRMRGFCAAEHNKRHGGKEI